MATRVCRNLCDPDAMARFSRRAPARRHCGIPEARAALRRVEPRRRTRAAGSFGGRKKTLTTEDTEVNRGNELLCDSLSLLWLNSSVRAKIVRARPNQSSLLKRIATAVVLIPIVLALI